MSNGESREKPFAPPTPERGVEREPSKETEKSPERPGAAASETPAAEKSAVAAPAPVAASAPVAQSKDPELMKVERALERNLGDIFIALPPGARQKFKVKGEETALSIRKMLDSAKVKARKVLHLIRAWLKLIPHVNKYFLEQEAKIKTDVIMGIAEDKKRSAGL